MVISEELAVMALQPVLQEFILSQTAPAIVVARLEALVQEAASAEAVTLEAVVQEESALAVEAVLVAEALEAVDKSFIIKVDNIL